ncbi:Gram-negative bacterial tonB protein [compost metagenome]
MRWLGLVLLLCVAGDGVAGALYLVPDYNPKPKYPRELQRAGISGEVQIGLTILADGSVSQVRVLESTHPGFAEAAKAVISQWRFKSWAVDADTQAEVEVVAPMRFSLDLDLPLDVNQWLSRLLCREITQYTVNTPRSSWVDTTPFHYTRGYLSNVFHRGQLPETERLALIATLNASVPDIVDRCREHPSLKYKRVVPAEIRKLL